MAPARACRSTGTRSTRPSPTSSQARRPAGVPAQPRPRRGLPRRRPRRCGTSRSRPPSPRPSWRRATTPAPTTASPSTGPTATPVYIETTRPELIAERVRAHRPPGRRALPAACSARPSPRPLFGVEIPVLAARGRRAGQGRRHRDVLHLRRPHRRHLVARAAPADPHGHQPRRPPPGARRPSGSSTPTPTSSIAGKTTFSAREATVAHAARDRRPRRRAEADHSAWRTSTRRATSRSRSSSTRQWYISNGGRDDELRDDCWRAATSWRGRPTHMQHRYEQLGRRPQRRLADLAGSASSACRSPSGTPWTPTASPTTTTRSWPTRRPCRSTRRPRARAGLHRATSAACPAASSATPTSWTPGPRRR